MTATVENGFIIIMKKDRWNILKIRKHKPIKITEDFEKANQRNIELLIVQIIQKLKVIPKISHMTATFSCGVLFLLLVMMFIFVNPGIYFFSMFLTQMM